MKENKKETKFKLKFNVKETLEKVKNACNNVKEKISTNIKSGELKKINKQSVKYYSMLLVMLFVAAIATYANIKSYKKANEEEYKTYVNNKENVSEEKEKLEEAIPVTTPTYEIAQSSITYVANSNSDSVLPVEGNIKREYSMDKVVYYESLEVWKTHSGVDIECKANSPVKAVLNGKVVGIYNDGMYGYSVVVEGQEYNIVYSSLTEYVLVSIGKEIKAGDIIGYAGECPAEKEIGNHLHLEVMKDGEYVNPEVLGIK